MYDHSMEANITFKTGQSAESVLKIIKPIVNSLRWPVENGLPVAEHFENEYSAEMTENVITSFRIYTCGDVDHFYQANVLDKVAENLENVAKAGSIILRDFDTPELEDAISIIWYGEPSEVAQLRTNKAWADALAILTEAEVAPEFLTAVETVAHHAGAIL